MEEMTEKQKFVAALLAGTGNPVMVKAPETDTAIQNIDSILKELKVPIDALVEEMKEFANACIEVHKEKEARQPNQNDNKSGKTMQDLYSVTQQLFTDFRKQDAMWAGISQFSEKAQSQLSKLLGEALTSTGSPLSAATAATSQTLTPPAPKNTIAATVPAAVAVEHIVSDQASVPAATVSAVSAIRDDVDAIGRMSMMSYTTIAGVLDLVARKTMDFTKALGNPLDPLFKGVIADQATFQRNLRSTLFTTEGYVETNRELEKVYTDITNAVDSSGVQRGLYQKVWLKNLERGFKLTSADDRLEKNRSKARQKAVSEVKAVTTTGLATAQALDMSAESTNEMFMNWSFALGMSSLQMGNISRDMRQIARSTGVTGTQLEKSLQSASQFMELMKSSATLTDTSSSNIIAMAASLEKYGMTGKSQGLMSALTSRFNFSQADDKTKNFVTMVASGNDDVMQDVLHGKILQSADSLEAFASGIPRIMQTYLGTAARDVLGVDQITNDNMSEVIKGLQNAGYDTSIADMQLQNAFGLGLGDIDRLKDAFSEASAALQPFGVKMKDLKLQIGENIAAGKGELDATKEMQRRLDELNTDALSTAFTRIAEQSKEGFGQDQLMKRLTEDLGSEMAGDFQKNLSEKSKELTNVLTKRANEAGMNLSQLLQKRGFSVEKLQKGLISGDEAALGALNEVQQELTTLEKASSDPLNEIQNEMIRANNHLGAMAGSFLMGMNKGEFYALIVGSLAASGISSYMLGGRTAQLLGGLLPGKLGRSLRRSNKVGLTRGTRAYRMANRPAAMARLARMKARRGVGSAGRGLRGAGRGLRGAGRGLAGASWGSKLLAFFKGGSGAARGVSTGARVAGIGTKLGAGALKLGLSAGTGGILLGVFAVLDGILGGFDGYHKTLENFSFALTDAEGNTKEMGWAMTSASTISGVLIGVLDGLTLGLLSITGLYDPLQKFFSWVLYTGTTFIDNFIKGFAEGFTTTMAVLKPAFTFLQDTWTKLERSVVELANELGLSGDNIQQVFMSLWKAIEPIAKEMGRMAGWLAAGGLAFAAKALGYFIEGIRVFVKIITLGVKLIKALYSAITGDFKPLGTFFKDLAVSILKSMYNLARNSVSLFWTVAKAVVVGLWNMRKNVLKGLWNVLTGLPGLLWDAVKGIGSMLLFAVIGIPGLLVRSFIDFGRWLIREAPGWFADLGTWVWDGIKGLPSMLYNKLTSVFVDFSTYLYTEMVEGLAKVKDYIMSWVPGSSFWYDKNSKEKGSKIGADGSTASTVASVAVPAAVSTAKTAETIMAAASPHYRVAKAVRETLFGFDEGTRKIESTGVAVLHQGEMVVPKNEWEAIRAVGSGAFSAADGSMMKNGVESIVETVRAAGSGAITSSSSNMMEQGVRGVIERYSPENIRERMMASAEGFISSGNINELLQSAVTQRVFPRDKSESNIDIQLDKVNSTPTRGEIRPTPIDGTEEASSVNPIIHTRGDVETAVERRVRGEASVSSVAMIPHMDAIADYLIQTQSEKLDTMIELLQQIEKNTEAAASARILMPSGAHSPVSSYPGLKRVAREHSRGQLDLQPLESQSSSVNTDGRGGY